MKVLRPGHQYELSTSSRTCPRPTSAFSSSKRSQSPKEGPDLRTINDGTTNEEVLRVLIDRVGSLQAKFPCRENALAITKLEESLMWLEKRTADRKARGVEGKQLK